MGYYKVTWTIDVEADTPEKAAIQALQIQRDPNSIATVFQVLTPSTHNSYYVQNVDVSALDEEGHYYE
jgi:hypothetical protein